jgi:hypothetical protein
MFMCHEEHSCNGPRQGTFARCQIFVQCQKTLTNPVAELDDAVKSRPIFVFFWNVRMVVAVVWVVDMWVDASLTKRNG